MWPFSPEQSILDVHHHSYKLESIHINRMLAETDAHSLHFDLTAVFVNNIVCPLTQRPKTDSEIWAILATFYDAIERRCSSPTSLVRFRAVLTSHFHNSINHCSKRALFEPDLRILLNLLRPFAHLLKTRHTHFAVYTAPGTLSNYHFRAFQQSLFGAVHITASDVNRFYHRLQQIVWSRNFEAYERKQFHIRCISVRHAHCSAPKDDFQLFPKDLLSTILNKRSFIGSSMKASYADRDFQFMVYQCIDWTVCFSKAKEECPFA